MYSPGSASLDPLFRPRSVALVGASDDVTRISGRPLRYLRESGFAGRIYPVNARRSLVQGLAAFPSISALPEAPDLAVLLLPASLTKAAVQECAAAGVSAGIVLTAGFAETGAEGRRVQMEMAQIARGRRMRLLGPNCLGAFNSSARFYGTFSQSLDNEFPRDGGLSVVSQSGAFASHLLYLVKQRNLGVRYWASTGNEADIEFSEVLRWMAVQPDVEVIVANLEGVRNGPGLIEAFRVAHERRKAVIVLKIGRSQAGARAATSHTASLTGRDEVYEAVFRRYGVYRAQTTEECMDVAYACSRGVYPPGNRLGIVTISGGVGVQMCDEAEAHRLEVPPMPPAAQTKLAEMLPYAGVANPIDVTAQALNDMGLMAQGVRLVLEEGGYDSVIAFLTSVPCSKAYGDSLLQAMISGAAGRGNRLVVLSLLAPPEIVRAYEEAGFLVFEDVSRAVNAIAAVTWLAAGFSRPLPVVSPLPDSLPALVNGPLSEVEAKRLLSAHGIPLLPERLVQTPEEAAAAAIALGFPVAVKIVSPDIPHKSDVGGVALNVSGKEDVTLCARRILEKARAAAPAARIDGLLVSPMAPKGVETIIGVSRDPTFGPIVLFGLGGVLVEVLHDVTLRPAPVDEREALEMIREIKAYPILEGVRGAGPSDLDALASAIATISRIAASHPDRIESIEINPFLVLDAGRGGVALDAVVVPVPGSAAP